MVKLLLDGGADVNKATNEGSTAFSLAQRKGHVDIANVLTNFKCMRINDSPYFCVIS